MTELSPRTLLVIDDDPSVHDLVKSLLAHTEWEVDCVASGEAAITVLAARAYDLILTDILMPQMDGLTLLARIRDRHPDARIIMMTAANTPEHVLGSLRGEAAGYISKPLFRDSLIKTLRTTLSTPLTPGDIRILSDLPQWITLQVACRLSTANRLTQFVGELPGDLSPEEREQIASAFRELLMNAIEHGGHFDPTQTVELSYIRTARSIVYYIRDPGAGFSFRNLEHAAIGNSPDEPIRHCEIRERLGLRPGGFGLLLTKNFADELIYNSKGNEVIFVKYL